MRALFATLVVALLFAPAADAKTKHPLSYHQAKVAAKKRADRFAHQPTQVKSMIRQSVRDYYARADWDHTDPTGCKGCGYDPDTGTFYDTPSTESCSVTMNVHRSAKTGRISTKLEDSYCY
jgi:hypothetical protein